MDIKKLLREALLKEDLPNQNDLESDYGDKTDVVDLDNSDVEVNSVRYDYPEKDDFNPVVSDPVKMEPTPTPKPNKIRPTGPRQPKPAIGASQQPNEENIKSIIDNNYRVRILYQGEDEVTPKWRDVDIYAMGMSKANNRVIRVYQASGFTTRANPKWKLFRLDRIKEIKLTGYHYGYSPVKQTPHDGNTRSQGNYNPNGDLSMTGNVVNKKF